MTVQNPFAQPSNASIVRSTIPVLILCHVKTASTIVCGHVVQSANDGDADDFLEVIYGAANSKIIRGIVIYNEANRKTLGENNATVTKDTTFAAADGCWVATRVPVIEAVMKAQQGTQLPVLASVAC